MDQFLLQLFIFFVASAIAVPIARKIGLGSVLGYLIAGIVIGPFGLSLISDVESVMHFTEFGVVMMLFLVGLELKPSMLWGMRIPILGMGGTQVIFSGLIVSLVLIVFIPWQQAVAAGLILALSSTAIVVQTLKEKNLINKSIGRSIFSVLLFQDLAVIPMLALLPLLSTEVVHHGESHSGSLIDISSLPGFLQLVIILFSILLVFIIGKYGSKPLFRAIAQTKIRELFVAASLSIIIGISLLMSIVGLSPALGTFIAGVVLAESEYRHELESDIEPFKGLLLGIFFISIGASLNFILIKNSALLVAAITAGFIILKFLVLFIISILFKIPKRERTFYAISLAGGGEFAFVLFQLAKSNGVLTSEVSEPFVSAVAISMFLSPFIIKLHDLALKSIKKDQKTEAEEDKICIKDRKVILAGFGQLGTDIGRFLLSAGIKPTILDNDASNIEVLRKFGFEVYYGDVTRLDLLESAGAGEAELIIITISDLEISKKLVELVSKHYPQIKIVANSTDMSSTFELMDLNVSVVRRESFGSALLYGQDILRILGIAPYDAYRLMRIFNKHNDEMINEMHKRKHDGMESFISGYRKQMNDLEELMKLDMEMESEELDRAWTGHNPEQ